MTENTMTENTMTENTMTWILFAAVTVLSAAAGSIRLLAQRAFQAPDRAWRPTGIRFTTGRDYLQAQGIANSLEARKHTATGRRYRRHPEPVTTQAEAVNVTSRRVAEVVQLHRRQA